MVQGGRRSVCNMLSGASAWRPISCCSAVVICDSLDLRNGVRKSDAGPSLRAVCSKPDGLHTLICYHLQYLKMCAENE